MIRSSAMIFVLTAVMGFVGEDPEGAAPAAAPGAAAVVPGAGARGVCVGKLGSTGRGAPTTFVAAGCNGLAAGFVTAAVTAGGAEVTRAGGFVAAAAMLVAAAARFVAAAARFVAAAPRFVAAVAGRLVFREGNCAWGVTRLVRSFSRRIVRWGTGAAPRLVLVVCACAATARAKADRAVRVFTWRKIGSGYVLLGVVRAGGALVFAGAPGGFAG